MFSRRRLRLGQLITVTLPHVAPRSERAQTQKQQIKGFYTRGLDKEGPVSMAVSALNARSAAGPVSVSMAVGAMNARSAAGPF